MLWKLLIWLRVTATLWPQSGYVHPDEFFQSLEVVAGDVLHVQADIPWEFNTTITQHPIRNVCIPYLIVGMPLYLLKILSTFTEALFSCSLISSFTVLMFPRLLMVMMSLFLDVWLYRICKMYKRNHMHCLVTFASSYVVIVFLSRTLTNTVETFLFACLLYNVVVCMYEIDKKLLKKSESLQQFEVNEVTTKSKTLGVILAVGIFNRPTFVAFSFVPLVVWVMYGLRNISGMLARCLSLVPGFLTTCLLLVIGDTIYFGQLSLYTLLFRWHMMMHTRWVVTPLNFVLYNMKSDNLMEHGIHPHYLHLLVNVPLLFGLTGVTGLVSYWRLLFQVFLKKQGTNIYSVDKLFAFSFIFPLLVLSVIPHQEPRFIIPLIFPLVFLHAGHFAGHSCLRRMARTFWIVTNVCCCFFYGFLQQGGVVQSLMYLEETDLFLNVTAPVSHVIYYHTYMPPHSLLLVNKSNFDDCDFQSDTRVHDLMGGSPELLLGKVESLHGLIVVASPTSVRGTVQEVLRPHGVSFHKRFWSHVSLEDPPPLDRSLWDKIGLDLHLVKVHRDVVTRVQYLSAV